MSTLEKRIKIFELAMFSLAIIWIRLVSPPHFYRIAIPAIIIFIAITEFVYFLKNKDYIFQNMEEKLSDNDYIVKVIKEWHDFLFSEESGVILLIIVIIMAYFIINSLM